MMTWERIHSFRDKQNNQIHDKYIQDCMTMFYFCICVTGLQCMDVNWMTS